MPDIEDPYMIWSNEHNAWWGPGSCGYAPGIMGAGTYTRDEALRICREAIPTAAHHGCIAEIPVRFTDVREFMLGAMIPASIMKGSR